MASNINTTNIDTAYPVAGQDNDSQGFRDNFFNTNDNFVEAKAEIEALQGSLGGNYVYDIVQVPDNSMDNWVLTYDHNAGVDSVIRLTALPVADETSAGIIELADQAEVDAGTDEVRAVTPLTLQTKLTAEFEPIDATILKDADIGVNVAAQVHTHPEADVSYGTTGAIGLDLTSDTFFYPTGTTTGAITFSFNNPAASGTVTAFTLKMLGAGDNAPVWPASVDWPAATEPTWTAGGTDFVSFITHDGGTTWYGMLGGLAFA